MLKISEAAEYLGVSSTALRRWDNSGILRADDFTVGGQRLYAKETLDNVVKDMRLSPKLMVELKIESQAAGLQVNEFIRGLMRAWRAWKEVK